MELLTIKEAAVWLRISESKLRLMRSQNLGPKSHSIGRRVVYDVADLAEFVRRNTE